MRKEHKKYDNESLNYLDWEDGKIRTEIRKCRKALKTDEDSKKNFNRLMVELEERSPARKKIQKEQAEMQKEQAKRLNQEQIKEKIEKRKELRRKEQKLYRQKYPEKVRKMVLKSCHKWRKEHPEKSKANKIVYSALRNGTLKKGKCFCGENKVEAHHFDYSNPLEVEWLCKKHHVEADKERKNIEKYLADLDQ